MAVKPSGQCEYCGHIRYTNDLFNGECVHCVTWAEDQINALRADVARLQAELEKSVDGIEHAHHQDTDLHMVAECATCAAIRAAREWVRK